jgi:phosphotransferase family enzyme
MTTDTSSVDPAAEAWIRERVEPHGAIDAVHVRSWATVWRVPTRHGPTWFKTCAAVQAFEPRLTAELARRWPETVPKVIAHEEERGWLLLGDAGVPIREWGNPPDAWLGILPRYAELQVGEAAAAADHIKHGVPDLRLAIVPARFEELLESELPLEPGEIARLRAFGPRLAAETSELAAAGIPDSIQHDDLHMGNVYALDGTLRVLDWGDASIGHPFASLVVTFRFLEEMNGLRPDDPWFTRLRDAYLEPWGGGLGEAFDLALRVGAVAHALARKRQRDFLPLEARPGSEGEYAVVLRRALALAVDAPRRAG